MRPKLLYRRLLHTLDDHGLARSLRRTLSRQARQRDPGPADFTTPATPHPFDLLAGTDTSGYTPGEQLNTGHATADRANTAYYAISPSSLWAALLRTPCDPAHCTFVDLGCGKGRALLVAEACGFAHAAGVELAPPLAAIARANCLQHANVRVETGDAVTFCYPLGPLVVFLYHPFLAGLQRRALRNLARQLRQNPRPCWLLCANPTYPRTLDVFQARTLLWDLYLPLAPADAAADRHGITVERYTLWRVE